MKYPNVFSPIQIGPRTVRNRIFVSAHHTGFALDGLFNERHYAYYEARAKGGAGMIVTGGQVASPWDQDNLYGLNAEHVFAPGQVGRYRESTKRVKAHGTVFLAQIAQMGRQDWFAMESMKPVYAPSAIPCPVTGWVPKALEKEELTAIIQNFCDAAEICVEGGFDGLEVHLAYGYLLAGFLSPTSNQREDEYGGCLENRMRFPLELLAAVRKRIGYDVIVGIRMLAEQFIDGGIEVEDAMEMAQKFEASGLIDYINATSGTYEREPMINYPQYLPMGFNLYMAQGIKEVIDLPVLAVGRIKDPVMMESIITNHQADMVGMARAAITDPDIPVKMLEGREGEIRNCIACNQKCNMHTAWKIPITCMQSPVAGREHIPFWRELRSAASKKNIAVIGAGPAGCEAAITLARRGHKVSLYERDEVIGGQVLTLQKAPGREEWQDVNRFHERELKRLKVNLQLGQTMNAEELLALKADEVIIATGSNPRVKPYDYLPVFDGLERALSVRDVLNAEVDTGESIVVYAGENHMQGLSVGEFLLDKGKAVQIVCPDAMPGKLTDHSILEFQIERLINRGLAGMLLDSKITSFDGSCVRGTEGLLAHPFEIPSDTLVSSFGGDAAADLYFALKGQCSVHRIGDAVAPRLVDHAIYDGARLGREL